MKKIAVLLMGLAVCTAYFAGCADHDQTFIKKSYTVNAAEIAEVCIDVRDRQIEATLSADGKIHIDYFESSKEYYNIVASDDHTITMTAENDKNWTDYIGRKPADDFRRISLQLPDALITDLTLSTTNEDILLPVLSVIHNLSLSSQGGNIVFDKLNAGESIRLDSKNGNISGAISGSYDEYAIFCNIKKGGSTLPSRKENGTKTLTVSNNNGDVDVKFINE